MGFLLWLVGQGVELLRHFPSHSVVALVGIGAPAPWGEQAKVLLACDDGSADDQVSRAVPPPHTHTPGHAAHLERSRSCPLQAPPQWPSIPVFL